MSAASRRSASASAPRRVTCRPRKLADETRRRISARTIALARAVDNLFAREGIGQTRAVIVLWQQIAHGNALRLTGITILEIAACLCIATMVGVFAGFLLWRYKLIGNSYEMFLAALFSSPVILAYPIFLVTFGRTSAAVIALSSIFGLIPIIINTKGAFQNVNPILLQVGASMNLNRKQMFRYILVPAVAPVSKLMPMLRTVSAKCATGRRNWRCSSAINWRWMICGSRPSTSRPTRRRVLSPGPRPRTPSSHASSPG